MIEEMDLKDEDCSSQNISFDDNYNSYSDNELFLFSKENLRNGNEFFNFETEFKKVFNAKGSFGHILKEEEEKNVEPEKNEDMSFNKKKFLNLFIMQINMLIKKLISKPKKFSQFWEKLIMIIIHLMI